MTEIGWWYTGLFIVIVLVFYCIGFIYGKNYQQSKQNDIEQAEADKKANKKITGRVRR